MIMILQETMGTAVGIVVLFLDWLAKLPTSRKKPGISNINTMEILHHCRLSEESGRLLASLYEAFEFFLSTNSF
jgi:hypothetical protein